MARRIEVTDMSDAYVERAARSVADRIVDEWGPRWRAMLSPSMQRVVVDATIVTHLMQWGESGRILASDVQRIVIAARKLILAD